MDDEIERARKAWTHRGRVRPPFAREPASGQESVWDYPRPPAIVADGREIVVMAGRIEVARTRRALRVLETASPPTFYLPPDDVDANRLMRIGGQTFCEWKGRATYFDVHGEGEPVPRAAWTYFEPFAESAAIAGHFAFYPAKVACFVDGERVRAQAGGFYGGWITDEIVGPYKGEADTADW